jgi:plasmid maintenance system killer protein
VIYFADKRTAELARRQVSQGIPDEVAERAVRQLDILSAAVTLEEARFAGHGRIAKMPGTKPPRFCLHVHARWWIGFNWEKSNAYNVKIEEKKR